MNVDIALFFHICGVLTLVVSAVLEVTSLSRMRRTRTTSVARAWASLNRPLEVTFPLSVIVILASGLYMLHEDPNFRAAQPWAMTVLVLLVVLAILGAAFNGRRMQRILEALEHAPDGPVPANIEQQIRDPYLLTSIHAMSVAILGAVLLMTVKPGLRDSIIIAVISLILGALSAQPILRRDVAQTGASPAVVGAEAD